MRDRLTQQRAAIQAEWTEVDEAMKQRAAEIRDLADAAIASGVPASDVSADIAAATGDLLSGTTPQARIRASQRLSTDMAKLLISSENHARFESSRTFRGLQEQIRDSEERIAVARRKYNESLEHYNAGIQRFPYNLVAKIAGFRRNDAYFQTEPF